MDRKELVIISLIIFFSVVAWIVVGLNKAQNTSTDSSMNTKLLEPLKPEFDADLIIRLEKREK